MSEETYYTALGLAETASRAEIKRAYRALLKKIHPDTVSTLSEETRRHAEDATREINEAYEVLSDTGQRAEYDYFLSEKRKASAAPSANESTHSPASSDLSETSSQGVAVPLEHKRRRRRRRRSHHRHSSNRGPIQSVFHPVSATDWLVLFGYIFVAMGVLVFVVLVISYVLRVDNDSDSKLIGPKGQVERTLAWMNGAGYGDRTRDIELGKLAFYR